MSPRSDLAADWRVLGEPRPETLDEPRLQLHRAAQIVSAFAHTHVEPAPGDAHTSLEWLGDRDVLAGRFNAFEPRVRLALEPAALAVLVLDAAGGELRRFELDGLAVDAAYERVESSLAGLFDAGRPRELVRPVLELPPGPGAGDEPFALRPAEAFAELARWYADADLVLRAVAAGLPGAPEVRCWPHHFDLAFLAPIERPGAAPGSIGAGLSPGDDSYPVPYWYVTPYPAPDPPPQPELGGGGHWHTGDWFGAVLPAVRMTREGDATAQLAQIETFLRSALAAGRRIVAAAPLE